MELYPSAVGGRSLAQRLEDVQSHVVNDAHPPHLCRTGVTRVIGFSWTRSLQESSNIVYSTRMSEQHMDIDAKKKKKKKKKKKRVLTAKETAERKGNHMFDTSAFIWHEPGSTQ